MANTREPTTEQEGAPEAWDPPEVWLGVATFFLAPLIGYALWGATFWHVDGAYTDYFDTSGQHFEFGDQLPIALVLFSLALGVGKGWLLPFFSLFSAALVGFLVTDTVLRLEDAGRVLGHNLGYDLFYLAINILAVWALVAVVANTISWTRWRRLHPPAAQSLPFGLTSWTHLLRVVALWTGAALLTLSLWTLPWYLAFTDTDVIKLWHVHAHGNSDIILVFGIFAFAPESSTRQPKRWAGIGGIITVVLAVLLLFFQVGNFIGPTPSGDFIEPTTGVNVAFLGLALLLLGFVLTTAKDFGTKDRTFRTELKRPSDKQDLASPLGTERVARPETQAQDIKARLTALTALLEDGIITSSEYETKRQNIIEQL
jgi:hypothetical protein